MLHRPDHWPEGVRLRPLLVGQAPGPNTNPELPLFPVPSTSAGGRLQQLLGLSRSQYLKTFDRVNVLYHFPGKHQRDDKFPLVKARAAAEAMRPLLVGRYVILVGRNVANVFGLGEMEFLQWQEIQVRRRNVLQRCPGGAMVCVVPHPSGRNHWYNDKENAAKASAFLREVAKYFSNQDQD